MSANDQGTSESDRRTALGYEQKLSRVLSIFDNFAVAFASLSPVAGVYSTYAIGLSAGGPRDIWTIPIAVAFMTLVALVFGELGVSYRSRRRSTSTARSTWPPVTAGSWADCTGSPRPVVVSSRMVAPGHKTLRNTIRVGTVVPLLFLLLVLVNPS